MKKTPEDIQNCIIDYLKKQEWPSTSEDVAKGCKLSWNTANFHLHKLEHQGKVKFRRVGRQNQWWLEAKYRREMK